MGLVALLLILALIFGGVGLFVEGLKWLLIIAVVLFIASFFTGFRGRSGRSFRAKLKLEQNEEGKWRVDFDEDWAREPRATPPAEEETAPAAETPEPEKVAAGVADESA